MVHWLLYSSLIILFSCNQTVCCRRTVEAIISRPSVNHSYDHRSKWSPLSLITIMFNWSSSFILPYKALCIFPWFDKMFFALHPSRISMISLIIQWQFIFVGLDEAKDINDSVSGQMSSSKYAGLQWWRELAKMSTPRSGLSYCLFNCFL